MLLSSTIPYYEREQMTHKILNGETKLLKNTEVKIDYLVVEKKESEKVYENQKYVVLKNVQ